MFVSLGFYTFYWLKPLKYVKVKLLQVEQLSYFPNKKESNAETIP